MKFFTLLNSFYLFLYFQGRTFGALIKNFLQLSGPLNDTYLPLYETPEGRKYLLLIMF